jgi:deoxyribonuclease V
VRLDRLHSWDVTPREAVAIQKELRARIVADAPLDLAAVRTVAGVDVSVKDGHSHAAIVVASFPDFAVIETATARAPTPFPYVPGLLSFREGPVLEAALGRLTHEPDVFVFDGMGIAHPRRIGIASHMGLWLDRPTVGCGKTLLVGRHEPLPEARGASRPLIDRGEVIGAAVRTRTGKNPVFISPGHRADVDSAVALILACAPRFRLPEPIRLAHKAAGLFTP